MILYENILNIYPNLIISDFFGSSATIHLQNDSDGKGDYIAKWEHPTLPRPAEAQLK